MFRNIKLLTIGSDKASKNKTKQELKLKMIHWLYPLINKTNDYLIYLSIGCLVVKSRTETSPQKYK